MKTIIISLNLIFLWISAQAQFTFTDNGQRLGNSSSNDVALGDIDGDGDLDAFVINGDWDTEEPNEVWFNDGNGNFTAGDQVFENSKCGEVGLADLDDDGDLDAFIAYYYYTSGEPNEVWFNDGTGHFTDSGQRLGHRNGGVALSDLDSDGDIDAFICNHIFENGTNGGLKIWLNDSTGHFIDSGQDLGNGNHTSVDLGDVDGDGDIDAFVTYNFNSAGNKVWINDGHAVFSAGQTVSMEYSVDAKLGDLDGDGDLDIFITHHGGNKIWNNDGNGNFTDSGQTPGNADASAVGLADFDGDSDLDAFILNALYQEPETNEIWSNDGAGIFTDSGLRPGTDESYDVALGDLDNDGDPDAFVAIVGANKVWLNSQLTGTNLQNIKNSSCIFPNPASQTIQIKGIDLLLNKANYQLTDLNGKTIKQGKLDAETIDISRLPKGIYMLSLYTDEGIINEKIVVE